MLNLQMTPSERDAFLEHPYIGVFAVNEPGRGACAVPVWYLYEPQGPLRITAGADSNKVRLLRQEGRASVCIQREALPSAYVTVEGPVSIRDTDVEELQRTIAIRYLGEKNAEKYLARFANGLQNEVTLELSPQRWWSADFSKLK